jgi:hypothetical protein
LVVVRRPESGGSVVRGRSEVVAQGGKFHVPDWEHVAFVNDQACPNLETPQADGCVFGAAEE